MTPTHRILGELIGVPTLVVLALVSYSRGEPQDGPPTPRMIEVLADHDSRYKVSGMKQPEISVKADQPLTLRITAKKAKNHNREGSIHGFTLLRAKDRRPVPGWDFQLMPGTQDFSVVAPAEPGEYVVICTVVCSEDHEGMTLKFIVVP
jgi:heme/copper-type cytochrome/quinol oxidase subunit 2